MTKIVKYFIEKFHNLPGETVKAKHKRLFELLHEHISLKKNEKEVDLIVKNLKPSNHFEKILYVDVLIYFERFNELYAKYKSGEEITIKKLAKKEWFFQKAFGEIKIDEFVNDLFPTISYALKVKILRRLPIENTRADDLFDAVYKQYGLFLALNLISKCTSTKIREIITTQPAKLTQKQLEHIFNKDPNLIYLYFEEQTKHVGNSNFMTNASVLIYIAQKNPKMFSDLFNKYNFYLYLGRRTTKNFVDSQKETILKNPKVYLRILNNPALIRKLGKDVVDQLIKESPESGNRQIKDILKYYPKSQQFNLLRSAHDSVYRVGFTDNLDYMVDEVFDFLEDPDERDFYAKQKIEQSDDENYLKYVKPDYCLKKFMEKVNYMRSPERAKYVGIALFCCILNKDYDNLLKISELVSGRFKNDDSAVREAFFGKISSNSKVMDNFTEEHWKTTMEIVATSKAKKEWIWNIGNLIACHLKYLILNNKPIEEITQKPQEWNNILSHSDATKDPKIFKPIITELIKTGLVKIDVNEELSAEKFDCMLASLCKTFNDKHPEYFIEIRDHPRIISSVKKMLEEETSLYIERDHISGVRYIVCQSAESEEIQELKKLYFSALKYFGDIKGVMWFLKNEPKILQENFDTFLDNFLDVRGLNIKKFWWLVKKHVFLGLDERTITFCKQKIGDEFENKDKLVRPLTILSSPSSHLEFINTYIPKTYKVDFTNDEEKEIYNIQGKLFRFLHLLRSPNEVGPVALKLCEGDYLQFALSPLYSCIYNLPENETKTYIEKLNSTKAISVKKHALNLSCVIYNQEVVYSCLKNATVPSLVATVKYFAKNPTSALWDLISSNISSIDKKDLTLIKRTLDVVVPFDYKSQFVEVVWQLFDKYESKDFKKILLPKIDHGTIQNFKMDFAINIIKGNIFKIEEANDFVANLFVHLKTEEKFKLLSDILNEFKKNCWDNAETQRLARRKLHNFIQTLFKKYMAAKKANKKFVLELSTIFKSIFPLSETFEETVIISLMCLKDETSENSAKIVAELNSLFEEKYGRYAVHLLAAVIRNFVYFHILKSNTQKLQFCHALLNEGETVNNQLLILKLLPKEEPELKENFSIYKDIMTKISQTTDDAVQLQLNLYLKDDPSKDMKSIDWDIPIPICPSKLQS